MPSSKPKIQGNVDAELYAQFSQWKQERGFPSDSLALNALIGEFFGKPLTPVTVQPDLEELVEKLLEKKLDARLVELEARIIETMVEQRLGNVLSHSDTSVIQGDAHESELAHRLSDLTERTVELTPLADLMAEELTPVFVLETLTGAELGKRLGVNPATLIKNREKQGFAKWAKAKDPMRLGWEYLPETKRYQAVVI